ncbi:hypothetical protein EYF80_033835 [Liparis tanakae]|uniref:Uncharacterized protein n=1 Tax=Liparis tanakae TaxID=230148 RepID=A0A4Z2GQJ0_9TELE|nr:hypothetical protein EYF80_033835 [Liparis tanakae]
MSLEESVLRDMAESETDCSEGLDEVVLGRISSLPLDPFPPRDFRGKFKKMRHKKRPTILENVACSVSCFLASPSPLSVASQMLPVTLKDAQARRCHRYQASHADKQWLLLTALG